MTEQKSNAASAKEQGMRLTHSHGPESRLYRAEVTEAASGRIWHMLGLAAKAGRLKSGGFLTVEAVRGGNAALVIVTEDAEGNTRKTAEDKCRSYHVPLVYYGTKDRLGQAIGKGPRACAAVTDQGFADSLMKMFGIQEERGKDGEDESK
jgi:ribosomal protein L7Ae-like RNA K-turn-binding protein